MKMLNLKNGSLVSTIVILVLAIPFICYSAESVPIPIKIGLLFDYTGMGSFDIPFHENGVKLKLDEVKWQVEGRKIELIRADNASDPVKGAEAAKKLVQEDKVDVVIGPVWGHVALAIGPILGSSKTPNILTSGQVIDVVRTGAGNVFMTRGTFCGNSYYSGVYAYEELGCRTAVVMYDDFVTGEAFVEGFIRPFKEKGGTIVQTIKPPLGTFDFAAYFSSIKNADIIAYWLQPPELPPFYKQYREFGVKMPLMYTSMTADTETWAQAGDNCIGTYAQHEYAPSVNNPANRKFMEAVTKTRVKTALGFQEGGYTAASIFLEAVKFTKGDTSHDKIIQALKKISIDTPEGRISYSPQGMGIGDELILKLVKKGDSYERQILKTYSQVTRKAPWE